MTLKLKEMCPHCNAIWGQEEIDWQKCHACGWPDQDEEPEDTDEYDIFYPDENK